MRNLIPKLKSVVYKDVNVLRWMSFAFLAFSVSCTQQSDSLTIIKLGHGLDQQHPVHIGMLEMGRQLDSISAGRMRIDIYPNQQLGTEREMLELLQIGSLGMTKVSSGVLENFIPEYKIFSLPYIFMSREHMFRVLEGEPGKAILQKGSEYWLRGLCYYDAGSRSFYTTTKPVNHPSDLDGQKIRTMESTTSMNMIRAMGGSATPIAWGELYTALQQGVVDGAENNPPSFFISRHYEVAKYYTLNEHTSIPDVLLISTILWESLNADQQSWLQEAADASYHYQKIVWQKASDDALQAVIDAGVEVIRPDKAEFANAVADQIETARNDERLRILIDQIRSLRD
jgi:tripartite ATP-independent transporter DctP family solute receptor